MRYVISAIAVLCAMVMDNSVLAQTADDEADVYLILMGEADEAIANEDYPTAAQRLIEALDVDPDNPSNVLLLSNLGTIYNYMDSDSLALTVFDEALRIAPSMTVTLENRGRLLLKMGREMEAYQDFGRIIELDSCNASARYLRGLMALYGGDTAQAERDFNVLESVAPDNINTKIAMSSLYSAIGNYGRAKSYYIDLLENDPSPENFVALAECCISDDNLSEASAVISKAIERYPTDGELYFCRAWLNKERYLLKEAHTDAKNAVKYGCDPTKVESLFKR